MHIKKTLSMAAIAAASLSSGVDAPHISKSSIVKRTTTPPDMPPKIETAPEIQNQDAEERYQTLFKTHSERHYHGNDHDSFDKQDEILTLLLPLAGVVAAGAYFVGTEEVMERPVALVRHAGRPLIQHISKLFEKQL